MVKSTWIPDLYQRLGHRRWVHALSGRPLFSIILATLNPGSKFRATLDSVLAQTGASYEVLVVDGGSEDGTVEQAEEAGAAVSLLRESTPGVYPAMNRGITEAKGQILYFLGAGDRLRPAVLAEIAKAWHWPRYGILYGDVWMEDLGVIYDGKFDKEKLRNNNLCHQGVFYSRGLFQRHGPYDPKYRILADYDFNLKIFGDPSADIRYLPLVMADYEGNGLSAGTRDEPFQLAKRELCLQRLGPKPKKKATPGPAESSPEQS